MREDNGIISRCFNKCIMCSLEGLALFESKTHVLHILIGPIKTGSTAQSLAFRALSLCLPSLGREPEGNKGNKNKLVCDNSRAGGPVQDPQMSGCLTGLASADRLKVSSSEHTTITLSSPTHLCSLTLASLVSHLAPV